MTIFDLVFLLAALSLAAALVLIVGALIRGRPAYGRRTAVRTAIGVAVYFAVLLVVSLASPQRRARAGQPQCSDDWCISVDSVGREERDTAAVYTIGFALSSRARRIAQHERFVIAYVQTDDGRRIDARPESITVPFDTLVQAGETVRATRQYVVPRSTRAAGVVVAREGGGRFPRCCIIGDENSLLHQRTLIAIR